MASQRFFCYHLIFSCFIQILQFELFSFNSFAKSEQIKYLFRSAFVTIYNFNNKLTMDHRTNKRLADRENFYNNKKDVRRIDTGAYNQQSGKLRIQTQPQSKILHTKTALTLKNASYFENNDRKTPSFNEDSFQNANISEVPHYKYSKLPIQDFDAQRQQILKPQPLYQRNPNTNYHYNPSIQDITRKYGIKLKGFKSRQTTDLNSSATNESEFNFRQPRSYSQVKVPRKNDNAPHPPNQETSDFELSSYRYKIPQRNTFKNFINRPHSKKPAFFLPSDAFSDYQESFQPIPEPSLSFAPSDPSTQETLESINVLNQKINEKVNRILCDEYPYY